MSIIHKKEAPIVSATELRNVDSIPRDGILELSFEHSGMYKNKFFDVSLNLIFTSPSGVQRQVRGFYYGDDLWKIRFRPDETGPWTYIYLMKSETGFRHEGKGAFECTPSEAEGRVLRDPKNPYRWIFSNGKPYFPVGLQDCFKARGTQFARRVIDGDGRGKSGKEVSLEEYFTIYGQAGFNLFRFSQKNCSYVLYDDLDHYREEEGKATDALLSLARRHGFRVMFGFFGFHDRREDSSQPGMPREEAITTPEDLATVAKEKRFLSYAVSRWGAYADFWQLLNERDASDAWTTLMANYVRSIDPDRKPISTSWQRPHLPAIDINSPHWYESESELQSDLRVQQLASKWKETGKPVVVGEQGNMGMNWDPLSGLRMRIRTWTALFQEISLIFWNTNWSKAGVHKGNYTPGAVANIYLGPEERGYIRVLHDFSSKLDAGMRITHVEVSPPDRVRAYGLLSKTAAAAYLHHFVDHLTTLRDIKITLDIFDNSSSKKKFHGEWIDPSTGSVIARVEVPPGRQTLDVPAFAVDLALLIINQK